MFKGIHNEANINIGLMGTVSSLTSDRRLTGRNSRQKRWTGERAKPTYNYSDEHSVRKAFRHSVKHFIVSALPVFIKI